MAAKTDVVWIVEFEVGTTATGVAGQDSGPRLMTGGASDGFWGRNGGGGRRVLREGISTFHKGSSDLGSKSR